MSGSKEALRREARERRRRFVLEQRNREFRPPLQQFDRWFDRGVSIASYRPVGSEADPVAIEALARTTLCFLSWPRFEDRNAGGFRNLGPRMVWENGPHGTIQPPADGWLASPHYILVPLLAFDRRGTRLGQGAGWYDQVLPQHPGAVRIGVGWSVQEMDELPRDAWDVPMHYIVTDKEWIDCGQS
jgi:5-formyltetrahydrofolate cyclo-ligase